MIKRICRYNCGIELGQFDEKENKYREASTGILHTRERCEAMKNTMRNNEKPTAETKPEVNQANSSKSSVKTGLTVEKEKEPLTLDQIDLRLKRVEKMLFNSGT